MISLLVEFFVPILYFLLATATLVLIFKKSFGKCLPIALILSALTLYLSQVIFGTFEIGFWFNIVSAVASVIFVAIFRKKVWAEFKKNYFTTGIIVFLVVYIIVFIYDFNRNFAVWDEFSHWGMMLREMLRLDKFYSVEASNLMVHKDYPPIMSIFELFWTKLCGGVFKEVLAERAVHTLTLSMILPFIFEKILAKKEILKTIFISILATFAVALVILLFDKHGVMQTIYNDYTMAIVVAYLIAAIVLSKKIDGFIIFQTFIGGCFLVLLKQMGLPLYLMVVCFLVIMMIVRKVKNWKKIVGTIVLMIAPILLLLIWNKFTAGVAKQFDLSSISLSSFFKMLITHEDDGWQLYTIKNFIKSFAQEGISTSAIPLSFFQGLILASGLFVLVYKMFKKNLGKKEMVTLGIILIIGAIGYTATMMILYVFSFGSYEGPILTSYERYMGTYLMICFAVILFILVYRTSESGQNSKIAVATLALAIFITPTNYARIYPKIFNSEPEPYSVIAKEIKENIPEEDPKILFIYENFKISYGYYMQYYFNPIKITAGDISNLKSIESYDYVYVFNMDHEDLEKYCSSTDGTCEIKENTLYKVISNYRAATDKQPYLMKVYEK